MQLYRQLVVPEINDKGGRVGGGGCLGLYIHSSLLYVVRYTMYSLVFVVRMQKGILRRR